jgi:hypothetical protein
MSTIVYTGLNPFNFIRKLFCRSAFGKSLCTYKKCWKWCPRLSIPAWTRLILFANIFCRSAFWKLLCTYKRCWKWRPWASIQAWTKSTYRRLSVQRLSERTVYCPWDLRSLGFYAAYNGTFIPTFQDNKSVPTSRVKMRPIGYPETSIINYHYKFRKISK